MAEGSSSAASSAASAKASALPQSLSMDTTGDGVVGVRSERLRNLYTNQLEADRREEAKARSEGRPVRGPSVLTTVGGGRLTASFFNNFACGKYNRRNFEISLERARARNLKREQQTQVPYKPEIVDTSMPSEAEIARAVVLLDKLEAQDEKPESVSTKDSVARDLIPDCFEDDSDEDEDDADDGKAEEDDDAGPCEAALRAYENGVKNELSRAELRRATWGAAIRAMKKQAPASSSGEHSEVEEGSASASASASASSTLDASKKVWRQLRQDADTLTETDPFVFESLKLPVVWVRYNSRQLADDMELLSFDKEKPTPLDALTQTPAALGLDNGQWQRHDVFHEHPGFVTMLNTGSMPVVIFADLISALQKATGKSVRTLIFRITKAIRNFKPMVLCHLPAFSSTTLFPMVRSLSGRVRVFPAFYLPYLYIFAKEIGGHRDAMIIAESRRAGPAVGGLAEVPASAHAMFRFFRSIAELSESLRISCACRQRTLMLCRRLSIVQLTANAECVHATLMLQARQREVSMRQQLTSARRVAGQNKRRGDEARMVKKARV